MKASEQTSPGNGKHSRTFPGADYVTPRDQAIIIEELSNGHFRPKFYRGGHRNSLGTFTSFTEAEKRVVKFIKAQEKTPRRPGTYPDKYKGT